MTTSLKIDFVSDIACPWCAIGLTSLQQALKNCEGAIQASIHFQPFELNPGMPPEGEDVAEHLHKKYGSTPEQQAQMRATIADRGEAVGFTFNRDGRGRIVNTFDAHRLLHWVGLTDPGKQAALKRALMDAYHGRAERVDHNDVLLAVIQHVGLDTQHAKQILESDEYADAVRDAERRWQEAGIHSVPAVVINDHYLISGGQPPEVFEKALRQIAADIADSV